MASQVVERTIQIPFHSYLTVVENPELRKTLPDSFTLPMKVNTSALDILNMISQRSGISIDHFELRRIEDHCEFRVDPETPYEGEDRSRKFSSSDRPVQQNETIEALLQPKQPITIQIEDQLIPLWPTYPKDSLKVQLALCMKQCNDPVHCPQIGVAIRTLTGELLGRGQYDRNLSIAELKADIQERSNTQQTVIILCKDKQVEDSVLLKDLIEADSDLLVLRCLFRFRAQPSDSKETI